MSKLLANSLNLLLFLFFLFCLIDLFFLPLGLLFFFLLRILLILFLFYVILFYLLFLVFLFLVLCLVLSSVSCLSISFQNLFFIIVVFNLLNFISISSSAFVSSSISDSISFMLILSIISCFSIFWFIFSSSLFSSDNSSCLLGFTFFICDEQKCKKKTYIHNNLGVLRISYILRQVYINDISAS